MTPSWDECAEAAESAPDLREGTSGDGASARPRPLDLSDPDVREMARRNHTPEETWTRYATGSQLISVHCETCRDDWPCETIRLLRATERSWPDARS